MALESLVWVALIKLALLSSAGFCGLRMCRGMLRSKTASDLRREAATSMLRPASFLNLSSHQQAAVFLALSECGLPHGLSMRQARFHGGHDPSTSLRFIEEQR